MRNGAPQGQKAANDLARLVQRPHKAKLDAIALDHRADLADSLPDHHSHLRFRVRAGDPAQGAVDGFPAIRYQPRGEPLVYADLCRTEEHALGGGGCRDHVVYARLVHDCCLAALSLGGNRPGAIFHVGINRHGAASEHCGDELGEALIRLGLCCMFRDEPIKFVTTTATSIGKMKRPDALAKLSRLCMENADALLAALQFCADNGIGCFRVNSQILPIKTHPACGYSVGDLPEGDEIIRRFKECGSFAKAHDLRTCFHPDQFVVLNSQRPDVVEKSLLELEYQAEVAEWIGADVVNIHGGGAFGNKSKALADFARNLDRLSSKARKRLTVENDDKVFTPADLLPICKATGIPLVYDVHHHRCNQDDLSEEDATEQAIATWNREPMFHLSSPIEGWDGPKPERHHDFIEVKDFPECWRRRKITVEVEAKAKEVAVVKLLTELERQEGTKNARQIK